jgi:hypothetical protein
MDPLPDAFVVYRAIRPSWLDPDSPDPAVPGLLPDAYYRRRIADEEGLSVSLCLDHARNALRNLRAVAALEVGQIRSLGLDVMLDPDDPQHYLITGLPHPDEDPDRAEHLAGRLARLSRLAWLRDRP